MSEASGPQRLHVCSSICSSAEGFLPLATTPGCGNPHACTLFVHSGSPSALRSATTAMALPHHPNRLVRVAVLGDAQTGKTSLISTAANDTFDARPPPVLPPVRLPREFSPDMVPMLITDTSSRPEDSMALDQAVQQADVAVICFDARRQGAASLA